MTRRLRITLIASATTLLVLVAAVLVLAFVMLRPERFTQALKAGAQQAGLELILASPARPSLWPRPGVRLDGLQLYVSGHSYPLLIAQHGRIVVPWRTLFGDGSAITTLQLDTPRLDLDQLRSALAALPAGSGKPPSLPRIGAGVTIKDGTLIHKNGVLLNHINLHTGALLPGQAFMLDASARDRSQRKSTLELRFTPGHARNGAIALRRLLLLVHAGQQPELKLAGSAQWMGGSQLDVNLAGHWTTPKGQTYSIALGSQPHADAPRTVHLKVEGKGGSADLNLAPARLAAWWKRVSGTYVPGPLPPPPLDGSLDAKELNVGSLHVKGLKLRSGNALPASAASSAKPARRGAGQ